MTGREIIDLEAEVKKLDTIIYTTPGIKKEQWLRMEIAIIVDRECLEEIMRDEDGGQPLTLKELISQMQRDMEALKQTKYGIRIKLPDWFKSIDCAEINEVKQ